MIDLEPIVERAKASEYFSGARLGDDLAWRVELQQQRLLRLMHFIEAGEREQQHDNRGNPAGQ